MTPISHIRGYRNRIAATLFFCNLVMLLSAQSLWNKTYLEDRPLMLFSSIIQDDSTYKIIGLTTGYSSPYGPKAMAASIDAAGTLIKYKVQNDSSNTTFGVFVNSLIKTRNGDFAFTGYAEDSLPRLVFARFDKNIDSLVIYTYYSPNSYVFIGNAILQTADSCFYIAGIKTTTNPGNGNVLLVKIDNVGNKIWEKTYDQYRLDRANSIIELINGNLLLGAFRNDLDQVNERANTWLLEIDTSGALIRQWLDNSDSTYAAEGLLQTSDNGFIYGAQKKFLQTVNSVYSIAMIVKLDDNFNKEWIFTGGLYNYETGFYDIEELSDGSFICCGNKPLGDSAVICGWIVKLSAAGDVIWDKIYRGINGFQTQNFLTDIDVLSDGSLIAVGQCRSNGQAPPQIGWFLKLDSNGCEIENCIVGVEEMQPEPVAYRQVKLYPNPAQNKVTIEYAGINESSKLYVVNTLGMIVETLGLNTMQGKLELNTSAYQNGIYLIRIEAEGKPLVKDKFIILK